MSENISITIDVPKENLLFDIRYNISNEDIIDFIIRLEKSYRDWEITEKLYKYFRSQKKLFDQECLDLSDIYEDWDNE